jgi:hypothetical protein
MPFLPGNRTKRAAFVLPALAAVLSVAGCGPGEKLVEVKGKVTAGGEPLANCVVTYIPEDPAAKDKARPISMTNEKGEYALVTNGKPGAPLGKYTVVVSTSAPQPGTTPTTQGAQGLDPKYSDSAQTDQHKEVVDKPEAGRYDLSLIKK